MGDSPDEDAILCRRVIEEIDNILNLKVKP